MTQILSPDKLLRGGTYKIIKVLGQGTFGITYLAVHTQLNKKVAIKEFFMRELNSRDNDGSITGMSDGSLSYNYAQKFKKEALNLAKLEHPNIVRVTDSFDENGTYYYVMDYIEGQNLNDYLKTHTLTHAEAVAIIKDVAKALMYMHEKHRMLHLDLKPGNIMRRNSDGHIFLIDFGLSKHYGTDGNPEESTNIGLGTAGYAPIEQSNSHKAGEFLPTIDVYALGATLYKLLTTETPPVSSEIVSDEDILKDCLTKHGITRTLSDVVIHSMQPSVRKRIPTVKAFYDALPQNVDASSVSAVITDDEATQIFPETPESDEETFIDNGISVGGSAASSKPSNDAPQNNASPFKPKKKSSNKTAIIIIVAIVGFIFVGIISCVIIFAVSSSHKTKAVSDDSNYSTTEQASNVEDEAVVDSTAYPDDQETDINVKSAEDEDLSYGYHEVNYDDGTSYKGEFKDGLWDGEGIYTDETGWYEGQFKAGKYEGTGTLYLNDHTWKKCKMHNGEIVSVIDEGTWSDNAN